MANAFEKTLNYLKRDTANRVIIAWWYAEGKRVFQTDGGRINKSWAPTTYKKPTNQNKINVLTGKLLNAVIGKSGAFISKRSDGFDMGIIYDRRAFAVINATRPVYDLVSAQMALLDQNIQGSLDRDIGK